MTIICHGLRSKLPILKFFFVIFKYWKHPSLFKICIPVLLSSTIRVCACMDVRMHMYLCVFRYVCSFFYWYYHECIIQSLNCTFMIISSMNLPCSNRQVKKTDYTFFFFLMLGGSWRNGSPEQIMTLPVPDNYWSF